MRKLSIPLLVLAAALSGCLKRKPPETVPNATLPDGTPVVQADTGPRPRVLEPTGTENESPFFIQGLVTGHFTSNTVTGGTRAEPTFNGMMVGVEGLLQPLRGRGIGVAGKVITGGLASPMYSDLEVLLGQRELAVGLGLGYRRADDLLTLGAYDSLFNFFSPSVRSRINLGNTGLSLASRAVRYFNLPDGRNPKSNLWGWHLESTLGWTAPGKIPFTAVTGFRYERLRVYNRRHVLGSFIVGGGLLLGRQPSALAPSDTVRNR